MSFSSAFHINNSVCDFSPDGQYLAYGNQNKLVVRFTDNYELCDTFDCVDLIAYVEWSPDAKYILAKLRKRSVVEVFSLPLPEWRCKLKDPDGGIIAAVWSPDSRHIVTTADCHVSLTIWSLVGRSLSNINQPKSSVKPSFSADGKWYAVVETSGKVDQISIFSAPSWQLSCQLHCPDFDHVGGVTWSPDSDVLCVFSDELMRCELSFYSMVASRWISVYKSSDVDKLLGIKTVAWPISGQFLAVGANDRCVRLLHHITWQCIAEFRHESVLSDKNYKVYEQVRGNSKPEYQEIAARPVTVSSLKVDPCQWVSKIGIGLLTFSHCCEFLATREDRMPAVVWIWSVVSLQLHSMLTHLKPVTSLSWDPVNPRLAITSGSGMLGLWTPERAECVHIPSYCLGEFLITSALWHPASDALALCADNKMTVLKL